MKAYSSLYAAVAACCILAMAFSHPTATVTGSSSYVRWGRTTCPSSCDTTLVYSGRAGGSRYNHQGGAADYLCLPDNPQYSDFTPGTGGNQARQSLLYGAEYETGDRNGLDASLGPLGESRHQRNVPCAVCATMTRGMQLMVPARVECPDDTWTREYSGYLMTDSHLFRRTKFICVDRDAEVIPNTASNVDGALMHHVRVAACGNEYLPCSTYDPQKELTCVVCSK